jgi:adenylate cyclase
VKLNIRPWIVITCISFMLGMAATYSRHWQAVELKWFDFLTVTTSEFKSVLPITIVGIDEVSFAAIGQRWPWSRDLHARVIDRLVADGAMVIAFDMIFSEPSIDSQDAEFSRAIRRAGNVVLAADHAYRETGALRQWLRVDPLPRFLEAGAISGLASAVIDGDAIMRRFPDANDIFWRQIISVLQRQRPDLGLEISIPDKAMVRHLGPAHTFPYVSYHQLIKDGDTLPSGMFQDQIVLIGRDVRASPEVGMAQSDLFSTPFLSQSNLLTPGVEIHATLIENALTGRALAPVSILHMTYALAVFTLLALPALFLWHPLISGFWIAGLMGCSIGLSYWLYAQNSIWMPVLSVVLTLGLMYLKMGVFSFLAERRRAIQIKATFSKYVAKQVVEQMVANPQLVQLGGERRELTLLFSDLAGFTSMSEKLAPETVAQVINLYLTEMTRIIIARGGTVDKFIGDAVMAFWGAPLADPLHALHGVEAAMAMQKAMDGLQTKFAELGVQGQVGLRIGLHTGPAIVGNMGSDERFDYTALGDTVNLASRLEGVNKVYGTKILFSATTANQLSGTVPVRSVDRVRVKGKDQPVDIFTPCDNAKLISMTEKAMQYYRASQWKQSETAWQQIVEEYPLDTLAPVFLERTHRFIEQPPLTWDGSVALEK